MIYTAKELSKQETKPGGLTKSSNAQSDRVRPTSCWNYLTIGIFENDHQIGAYTRKYPNFYNTFFPFQVDEKWYALYSSDYTATSVMELPSCKQIATEPSCAFGFCPVDFYIPRYTEDIYKAKNEEELNKLDEKHRPYYAVDRIERDYDLEHTDTEESLQADTAKEAYKCDTIEFGTKIHYDLNLAFVSGCVWGDDSGGWKVEHLDLSKMLDGVVTRKKGPNGRTSSLGYIELPYNLPLRDAVYVSGETSFTIAVQKRYYYIEGGVIRSE